MQIVGSVSALVLIWLTADLIYSSVVRYRLDAWRGVVVWDADGVREGCQSYTIGRGPVAVLLVHGFNNSPRLWDKMAPRLAEAGFTCRVMRLPGFAVRPGGDEKASVDRWLDGFSSELQALRAEHDRIAVVAHSLGAAIAIKHLTEQPQDADKVVLIAPAIEVSNRRSPLLPTRTWHTIGRRILVFTRTTESPFTLDVHDPAERDYAWSSRFADREAIDEVYALINANMHQESRFRTPMMMVLSREDKVIDWEAAKQFFDRAGSSEKHLYMTKDTGHAIPLDYGWNELAANIADWLKPSSHQ